jgi:tetratricopeptide (TPR) repeat protein
VPAASWLADLDTDPNASPELGAAAVAAIERQAADGDDLLLEQNHAALLKHYRSEGDGRATARIALKMLVVYNRHGYYHEAASFIDAILPHFADLAGDDENRRMLYVSELNSCLVMIGDQARSLRLITELAEPYLTKPDLLANVHYILAMHHLRFAKVTDTALAERHILLAVDQIRSVEDAPGSHEARFQKVFIDNGLAFLRVRQGRHQEALDLCQSGYQSLTSEVGEDRHLLHRSVLQYNTAQVYVMIGRLKDGLEYYNRSIEMDPHYSEYHNESGNILQKLERYEEAIEYYERAIAYGAPYPEVYFNKGVCHARQGDWEAALACFAVSLELNPSQPEIHALRAELFEALGRTDDALAEYDSAIDLAPDTVAARVNRAVLHFNDGAYELALSDMDHVITLEREEPSHYENRAAIYEAMGRRDLQARDLETAHRFSEAA